MTTDIRATLNAPRVYTDAEKLVNAFGCSHHTSGARKYRGRNPAEKQSENKR